MPRRRSRRRRRAALASAEQRGRKLSPAAIARLLADAETVAIRDRRSGGLLARMANADPERALDVEIAVASGRAGPRAMRTRSRDHVRPPEARGSPLQLGQLRGVLDRAAQSVRLSTSAWV